MAEPKVARPPLELSGLTKTQAAIAVAEAAMKVAHEETGLDYMVLAAGFATAAIAKSADLIGIPATIKNHESVMQSLREQLQ